MCIGLNLVAGTIVRDGQALDETTHQYGSMTVILRELIAAGLAPDPASQASKMPSQNVTRGWPIRSLALHESREHQANRQGDVSEALDKTEGEPRNLIKFKSALSLLVKRDVHQAMYERCPSLMADVILNLEGNAHRIRKRLLMPLYRRESFRALEDWVTGQLLPDIDPLIRAPASKTWFSSPSYRCCVFPLGCLACPPQSRGCSRWSTPLVPRQPRHSRRNTRTR